jgi:hypothetical protein
MMLMHVANGEATMTMDLGFFHLCFSVFFFFGERYPDPTRRAMNGATERNSNRGAALNDLSYFFLMMAQKARAMAINRAWG